MLERQHCNGHHCTKFRIELSFTLHEISNPSCFVILGAFMNYL